MADGPERVKSTIRSAVSALDELEDALWGDIHEREKRDGRLEEAQAAVSTALGRLHHARRLWCEATGETM